MCQEGRQRWGLGSSPAGLRCLRRLVRSYSFLAPLTRETGREGGNRVPRGAGVSGAVLQRCVLAGECACFAWSREGAVSWVCSCEGLSHPD